MLRSFERTLRAEGKSERTLDSYSTSVRMLSAFLAERGRELTVDVSREDIRDFITVQATRRKLPNGRMGLAGYRPGAVQVTPAVLQALCRGG